MMIRKDYVLIEEYKNTEGMAGGTRTIKQPDEKANSTSVQSDLKKSIFSNQVSDAKADLMMGKSVDVCL